MTWIRSSACSMGTCVEVRHVDGHVEVRDSATLGPILYITPADWAAFLVGAKAGEFEGPAAAGAPSADEASRAIFPVEPAQDTVWTIERGVIRTYTRYERRRWTREDWGQSGGGWMTWVTWEGIGGRADDRTVYLVKPDPS